MKLKELCIAFLICSSCTHGTKQGDVHEPERLPMSEDGAKIPMLVVPQDIPSALFIELTIDGVEHVLVHFDTAAPFTSLGPEQLTSLGLSTGVHEIWIGDKKNGVYVGKKMVRALKAAHLGPLRYPGVPPGVTIRGSAGTDLFEGLRIGIDFQGRNLFVLSPNQSPANVPKGLRSSCSGEPTKIPVQLAHSANAQSGGVILVKSNFGSAQDKTFLLDTGSNTNLALSSYWKDVERAQDKKLPLDLEDYRGIKISGAYRLSAHYKLGNQTIGKAYPVWVLDQFAALAAESQFFRPELGGLIGLWGLYQNYVVLDFSERASHADDSVMLLFPYKSSVNILDHYFTGFGFTSHGLRTAVQVEEGSDAAVKGVSDGDILMSVGGGNYEVGATGIILGHIGEIRDFTFNRNGKILRAKIKAQKLL